MKNQHDADAQELRQAFLIKSKIAYLKQVLKLQQIEYEARNCALKMQIAKALRALLKKYKRKLAKRNYQRLMILEENQRLEVEKRREAILFSFKEKLAKESNALKSPHFSMNFKPNESCARKDL